MFKLKSLTTLKRQRDGRAPKKERETARETERERERTTELGSGGRRTAMGALNTGQSNGKARGRGGGNREEQHCHLEQKKNKQGEKTNKSTRCIRYEAQIQFR